MLHFEIACDPELNLPMLCERLGPLLPPGATCSIADDAFEGPRVLVSGSEAVGVNVRVRQGPEATVLSLDRELVNPPPWLAALPKLARKLAFAGLLVSGGTPLLASLRTIFEATPTFAGPGGTPPRRISSARMRLLTQPGRFYALATLKLLAGAALLGFALFPFIVDPRLGLIPVFALIGAVGGRWLVIGAANLMRRLPGFALSLVPLLLSGLLVAAFGYARVEQRAQQTVAAEQEAWDAVAAGGPVLDYFTRYASSSSAPHQRELFELLAKRGVFLRRAAQSVPIGGPQGEALAEPRAEIRRRLTEIEKLADRPYDSALLELETRVRAGGHRLDGRALVLSSQDSTTTEDVLRYLKQHRIPAANDLDPADGNIKLMLLNDGDVDRAAALLREAPLAGAEGAAFAPLVHSEIELRTDDPEAPYIIVPAQYARSLAAAFESRWYPDWKWDERLYAQGKVVLQVPMRPEDHGDAREVLQAWEPVANAPAPD